MAQSRRILSLLEAARNKEDGKLAARARVELKRLGINEDGINLQDKEGNVFSFSGSLETTVARIVDSVKANANLTFAAACLEPIVPIINTGINGCNFAICHGVERGSYYLGSQIVINSCGNLTTFAANTTNYITSNVDQNCAPATCDNTIRNVVDIVGGVLVLSAASMCFWMTWKTVRTARAEFAANEDAANPNDDVNHNPYNAMIELGATAPTRSAS